MKPLCLYHANCLDGFAAATVVEKSCPSTEFIAAQYGKPPPAVAGRDVIIVDFSYPRAVLIAMAASAKTILILDHHKTAAEDLAEGLPDNVKVTFDMTRSGCVLAWKHFHPGEPVPLLLQHVQDRDLWHFDLANTRELMAALGSVEQSFDAWDEFGEVFETNPAQLVDQGAAILRYTDGIRTAAIRGGRRTLTIGGHAVPAVNAPPFLASEIGAELSQGQPFAATYFDAAKARIFSLRSTDAGLDVSAIAKQYGGGGHRNAAGFSVPFDHPLAYRPVAAHANNVSPWLPIETAPKDGRRVLFSRAGSVNPVIGQFVDGWLDFRGLARDPTHWMPLPPPPAAESESE